MIRYEFSFGFLWIPFAACTQAAPETNTCGPSPPGRVSKIYPTSDRIPENTLRFYVYFDASMRHLTLPKSITLRDSSGNNLDGIFLNQFEDLWSPDGTRLTLLLDPGRVKTGLIANEAMGRALQDGREYSLSVENRAVDENGCVSETTYSKSFRVVSTDASPPAPEAWIIEPPKHGTRDPLIIHLDGIYDHVSLAYRLRIFSGYGNAIPGQINLSEGETVWQFTPRNQWQSGPHSIEIDPMLEDVAGNRVTGLFDAPQRTKTDRSIEEITLRRTWVVSVESEP